MAPRQRTYNGLVAEIERDVRNGKQHGLSYYLADSGGLSERNVRDALRQARATVESERQRANNQEVDRVSSVQAEFGKQVMAELKDTLGYTVVPEKTEAEIRSMQMSAFIRAAEGSTNSARESQALIDRYAAKQRQQEQEEEE